MYQINRTVIVVKAKEPFLEWTERLPDPLEGLTLAQHNNDSNAYLFPVWDTYDELENLLVEVYDVIFGRELYSWHRNEREFPKNRTFAMFRDWFEVEHHSVVIDLLDEDIFAEEDYC